MFGRAYVMRSTNAAVAHYYTYLALLMLLVWVPMLVLQGHSFGYHLAYSKLLFLFMALSPMFHRWIARAFTLKERIATFVVLTLMLVPLHATLALIVRGNEVSTDYGWLVLALVYVGLVGVILDHLVLRKRVSAPAGGRS